MICFSQKGVKSPIKKNILFQNLMGDFVPECSIFNILRKKLVFFQYFHMVPCILLNVLVSRLKGHVFHSTGSHIYLAKNIVG